MWVWTKNRSFFLRKYASFIGISEIQRWGLLHYSYKKSQGDLPDHPKNWPVRLHVPSLFCHKNVDLGIFMHFFVILPKMPPTSRLLMGNPLDGFIGRKINSLECASLFLLMMHIPNKTVNSDCRYSIRPKNKCSCFRKWGWREKSSPGWPQMFFLSIFRRYSLFFFSFFCFFVSLFFCFFVWLICLLKLKVIYSATHSTMRAGEW